MKKNLLPVSIAALLITVMGCEPALKVTSDYDKQANFGQYKTFSLYQDVKVSDAISQLNHDRVINAIKGEMVKKGYQENTSSPDVLVNVVAIFKDRTSVSATTDYYGYGGYYRPYYWGGGMSTSTTNYNTRHYKDGSLIIDVVDANSKKLVWQGVGNKEIDKPAKDPDTAIPKAVASIMESFPPGASKKK
jgi:Domain of unknown function (DUF4136)